MRLQTIAEWSLIRSKEWKEGYAVGIRGSLRKSHKLNADHPDYVKGWKNGYTKFIERTRPDIPQRRY